MRRPVVEVTGPAWRVLGHPRDAFAKPVSMPTAKVSTRRARPIADTVAASAPT